MKLKEGWEVGVKCLDENYRMLYRIFYVLVKGLEEELCVVGGL